MHTYLISFVMNLLRLYGAALLILSTCTVLWCTKSASLLFSVSWAWLVEQPCFCFYWGSYHYFYLWLHTPARTPSESKVAGKIQDEQIKVVATNSIKYLNIKKPTIFQFSFKFFWFDLWAVVIHLHFHPKIIDLIRLSVPLPRVSIE